LIRFEHQHQLRDFTRPLRSQEYAEETGGLANGHLEIREAIPSTKREHHAGNITY